MFEIQTLQSGCVIDIINSGVNHYPKRNNFYLRLIRSDGGESALKMEYHYTNSSIDRYNLRTIESNGLGLSADIRDYLSTPSTTFKVYYVPGTLFAPNVVPDFNSSYLTEIYSINIYFI